MTDLRFHGNQSTIRLLIIEDDQVDLELVVRSLRHSQRTFEVTHATSIRQAIGELGSQAFDAVLLDLSLPDGCGLQSVERVLRASSTAPVIVLTGQDDELLALDALRYGVQDYLLKDELNSSLLVRSIRHAIERFELSLKAEAAIKAKGEFLANMSHEIRTPLTAIIGFTRMLHEDREMAASSEGQDCLATIKRSGEHLLDLVNDILDLSKIEGSNSQVEESVVEVQSLIDLMTSLFAERCQAKGITWSAPGYSDLPDNIYVDHRRLKQVLINLIGNAIKFTDQGTVQLQVSAKPGDLVDEFTLQIAVSDTGIGIDLADIEQLSQPFHQEDSSSSREYGGTGLGLTISRKLAQLMKGDIQVESKVGKGSCFTLTIPVLKALPANKESAAESDSTAACSTLIGKHILVVEDNIDNQRLVDYLLRRCDATVEMASNGQEAIDQIEATAAGGAESRFDAVLMDMQMPVLDGFQATRQLRQQGCKLPIIALTANSMAGDKKKCLEAGCDAYVAKPINATELINVIQRLASSESLAEVGVSTAVPGV